jgi:hydroxypyruvate reductase/glycerate 2-kinase
MIKNYTELATTDLRKIALDTIEAGINQLLPQNIMRNAFVYDNKSKILTINSNTSYNLSHGRIFIIGGGKASGQMAKVLEDYLSPNNITAGVVNCIEGDYKTRKIKVTPASHPIPDQRGVDGVKEMLSLKGKYSIGIHDIIICLISGGGSALMPYPAFGVSLEDIQKMTEQLLASGAEITEINIVRKHLSRIKGGQLGRYYSPSSVISLIISDVIGNDLSAIASGPTFPDKTTFEDAYHVLEKYDLLSSSPRRVIKHLLKGCRGIPGETVKDLSNCHNHIIGDNRVALETMLLRLHEVGFIPFLVTNEQKGDTTAVSRKRASEILNSIPPTYNALLIGGETTSRLPPLAGIGGRNQHYAAVSLLAMENYPGEWLVASISSDGSDFLPGVAGAIVDDKSMLDAKTMGINIETYINGYDSNTLLSKIGNSLVITGNTGTNVGDIILYLLR